MTIEWTARTTIMDKVLDRERWARLADWLAVALVVSLPWSTSLTGIFGALWLLSLIPTLDRPALRRVVATPAGGLPVLLWVLGLAGMLWSDAPLLDRLHAFGAYHKLLCIPLLMAQFERSERAHWLLTGFLGACGALLALSFALVIFPQIPWQATSAPGIPVKNYAAQGELFTIAAFMAAELARRNWQRANWLAACGFAAFASALLLNILVIATSRTALVVVPILLVLFGFRCWGYRGVAAALAGAVAIGAVAWASSPRLQLRVGNLVTEIQDYRVSNLRSSAGERLEFWRKSISFVAAAPILGHGTGTVTELYRRAAVGETGVSAVVTDNPHNQALSVAIQIGVIGVAVLAAMWLSHLLLFGGGAFAAWIGLAVVTQNFVGSLFNSQLFDFTHGWAYVIGVGVCGGLMLRRGRGRAQPPRG